MGAFGGSRVVPLVTASRWPQSRHSAEQAAPKKRVIFSANGLSCLSSAIIHSRERRDYSVRCGIGLLESCLPGACGTCEQAGGGISGVLLVLAIRAWHSKCRRCALGGETPSRVRRPPRLAGGTGVAAIPLTAFRSHVLSILARNRGESSHFAGSSVLHASPDSARFSRDSDIFHEMAADVAAASDRDVATLERAGIAVEKPSRYDEWQRETTFRRGRVREGNETLEIDWAADSSFRYFPVERDPPLGWRLHLFDIATNKALALASRTETRDYIDIVELHQTYPLAATAGLPAGRPPAMAPSPCRG